VESANEQKERVETREKVRKIRVTGDADAIVEYWQQAGLEMLAKEYRDEAARLYFLAGTFRQMTGGQLLRLAAGESLERVRQNPDGAFMVHKESRDD
jgi:hypothetical protein